jgi:FkbM family methyltransferase
MIFLDIGAHIGEYTLLGSHAVSPRGQVHAFEPNSDIFPLLKSNVGMNNLKGVLLNNSCVSDFDGQRKLMVYAESSRSALKPEFKTSFYRNQKLIKIIDIPSVQLDTYWSKYRKKIHLIKMDVEGAELPVLKGAVSLVALSKDEAPVWIFEYCSYLYDRFGYNNKELLEFFRKYGYDILHYKNTGQLTDINDIPTYFSKFIAVKDKAWLKSIVYKKY